MQNVMPALRAIKRREIENENDQAAGSKRRRDAYRHPDIVPFGIFLKIGEHLNLTDVLSSRRTCRRWQHIFRYHPAIRAAICRAFPAQKMPSPLCCDPLAFAYRKQAVIQENFADAFFNFSGRHFAPRKVEHRFSFCVEPADSKMLVGDLFICPGHVVQVNNGWLLKRMDQHDIPLHYDRTRGLLYFLNRSQRTSIAVYNASTLSYCKEYMQPLDLGEILATCRAENIFAVEQFVLDTRGFILADMSLFESSQNCIVNCRFGCNGKYFMREIEGEEGAGLVEVFDFSRHPCKQIYGSGQLRNCVLKDHLLIGLYNNRLAIVDLRNSTNIIDRRDDAAEYKWVHLLGQSIFAICANGDAYAISLKDPSLKPVKSFTNPYRSQPAQNLKVFFANGCFFLRYLDGLHVWNIDSGKLLGIMVLPDDIADEMWIESSKIMFMRSNYRRFVVYDFSPEPPAGMGSSIQPRLLRKVPRRDPVDELADELQRTNLKRKPEGNQ